MNTKDIKNPIANGCSVPDEVNIHFDGSLAITRTGDDILVIRKPANEDAGPGDSFYASLEYIEANTEARISFKDTRSAQSLIKVLTELIES